MSVGCGVSVSSRVSHPLTLTHPIDGSFHTSNEGEEKVLEV